MENKLKDGDYVRYINDEKHIRQIYEIRGEFCYFDSNAPEGGVHKSELIKYFPKEGGIFLCKDI